MNSNLTEKNQIIQRKLGIINICVLVENEAGKGFQVNRRMKNKWNGVRRLENRLDCKNSSEILYMQVIPEIFFEIKKGKPHLREAFLLSLSYLVFPVPNLLHCNSFCDCFASCTDADTQHVHTWFQIIQLHVT